MIYPGIARSQVRRKPIGSGPAHKPNVGFFEGMLIQSTRQGPTQQIEMAATQPLPPPSLERRPVPGPSKVPSTESVERVVRQTPSSNHVMQLEVIADDFRKTEFNLMKVLAESIVFLGLVLLNWSLELAKPNRIIAIVKVALSVMFLVLYPIYTLVSICALCLTYTYLKVSRRAKRK